MGVASSQAFLCTPVEPQIMSDLLEVNVVLSCTSTGKESQRRVLVPETVDELQDLIQERFLIPKCLQKLTLEDTTPLISSQKLTDVYIRSGDAIIVEYLSTAEVESVTKLCRALAPVVATFRRLFEMGDHLKGYCSISDDDELAVDGMKTLFSSMAYTCLLPWNQVPKVEANRQLLSQEGGLKLTIDLLSLLLKAPFSVLKSSLQMLMINCLSLLWNFAETHASRCMVVRLGGFQLMMQALLLHEEHSRQEFKQFEMFDLFDHVVGCVSNYSEIGECQLQLAQSSPALDLLLDFALHGSPMNVFTKMLVANCMFRLSHNTAVHQFLSKPPILEKILQFFANFNEILGLTYYNMLIGYVLSVTVSRMVLLSFSVVPDHFHSKIFELLDTFLNKAKVKGSSVIAAAEEKLQCNWITMVPFVDVFLTPAAHCYECNQSTSYSDQPHSADTISDSHGAITDISLSVMMFALSIEMSRKCNRELVIQQGLLDFVVSLPWSIPDKWKDTSKGVVAIFQKDQHYLAVPKLSSIAVAYASKCGIATSVALTPLMSK